MAKELKKLHASVQVELLRQVEELAERGGPAKQPKRLQHGVRVCEFICRGPHGHARLLLHETAEYVLVLEAFKKKGNSTPTANAVSRLAQWEEWHAN